jgi:hypothetical protein
MGCRDVLGIIGKIKLPTSFQGVEAQPLSLQSINLLTIITINNTLQITATVSLQIWRRLMPDEKRIRQRRI